MELHERVDGVCDQRSCLEFVKALAADREDEVAKDLSKASRHGPGATGWEAATIEAFLYAAVSWAEDSEFGKTQGLPDDNPWRQFATFLYCAKDYGLVPRAGIEPSISFLTASLLPGVAASILFAFQVESLRSARKNR